MSDASYSHEQTFQADPMRVFDAILDLPSWWSGQIDGGAARVGAEFRYRYRELHDSTQRVIALVPGQRVVWRVLSARLTFVDEPAEWAGTEIVFELAPHGAGTALRFRHVGLTPACACYQACARGWTTLLAENLRRRIESGAPQPDAFA